MARRLGSILNEVGRPSDAFAPWTDEEDDLDGDYPMWDETEGPEDGQAWQGCAAGFHRGSSMFTSVSHVSPYNSALVEDEEQEYYYEDEQLACSMSINMLQYPEFEGGSLSPPQSPRASASGSSQDREKVIFAELLSRAVAEDMAGLEAAWDVTPDTIDFESGDVDQETIERAAMIASLRRISDCAVATFAGQTLTPPQAEPEAAAEAAERDMLELSLRREEELESQLADAERRIDAMRQDLFQGVDGPRRGKADELMEQVCATVSQASAEAAQEAREEVREHTNAVFEQLKRYMNRVLAVESWQRKSAAASLQGVHSEVDAVAKEVACGAFKHLLPEQRFEPQRALFKMP